MARIFGWEIKKPAPEADMKRAERRDEFSPPTTDDGALQLVDAGIRNTFLDIDGSVKTEAELITRYRELSLQPEISTAIEDIVNEMVAYEEKSDLVTINLDLLPAQYNERIKKLIEDEFSNVVKLYDFNNGAYEIVRRWYIDGRMYYYAIVDKADPRAGIQELRYVDPRKMRKVRVIKEEPSRQVDGSIVKRVEEFFLYKDKGFTEKASNTTGYQNAKAVKISKDAIVFVTSGLMDPTNTTVLSYLHKSSKPLNQLRSMEDATIINRLVRAPMRRVFNVEVGALPKAKGEQYLRDQMVKYKNKLTYDATSGRILDNRHYMTMLEDFWFAKRQGNPVVEVDTLQGAADWNSLNDLNYFREQLYNSLDIPVSRLQPDSPFNLGRPSEITRDELKFARFVARLRLRFSDLFKQALAKQLILKGILTAEECKEVLANIAFDYKRDNFFSELKESEILQNRTGVLNEVSPYVGNYFSMEWIKKNILRQSDEEIIDQQKQMDKERSEGRYEQLTAIQSQELAVSEVQQQQSLEMQIQAQKAQPQPTKKS